MNKNLQKSRKSSAKKGIKKTAKKTEKSQKLVPKYIELKGFLSFFILHELSRHELSGDELAECVGSRKGAVLTPGTIYPALKRLRKQKLIRYTREGRKKMYILTSLGEKELKAIYDAFGSMFSGLKTRIKR
jgi:DNA-binding PadR family transcriptional regulator